MTNQTPEERDLELQLRDDVDHMRERTADLDQDIASILISTTHESRLPILAAMDAETLREVAAIALSWLDEFRNIREADSIFDDLWIRSRVALGTAPGAIDALVDDTPHDEPPC